MLTIGKAAAQANVTPDTLRYYQREGLIEPADRSSAGYRLYDREQMRRLTFIRQAQECGFTLADIRALLAVRVQPAACCGDVRRVAIEKKLQIEGKIRTMKAMSRALDGLIADCASEASPVGDCPILATLGKTAAAT
ncbi:MAG: heavy metal-responsive transcriptional regulator [Bradyrhizobium sp.]|nr:heavy metal-responsive transcriptional regulator [Bradyrhizobium sp.]